MPYVLAFKFLKLYSKGGSGEGMIICIIANILIDGAFPMEDHTCQAQPKIAQGLLCTSFHHAPTYLIKSSWLGLRKSFHPVTWKVVKQKLGTQAAPEF